MLFATFVAVLLENIAMRRKLRGVRNATVAWDGRPTDSTGLVRDDSELNTLCLKKTTLKNDTDVTHYRFNPHQPISVIFGRDVAERVCY